MTAIDLFISEYVEGSSFNKALELFNGTGSVIDLAAGNYTLELYSNGNSSPNGTLTLTGTINNNDVFVLANPSADSAILAEADTTNTSVINFNGDDTIVLRKNGVVIDVFGQIGVDPGSSWPGGGANVTLRRKSSISEGDNNPNDAFDASVEWDSFANDTFDGLGSHTFDGGTVTAGVTLTGTPQVAEEGETTDTYTIALDTVPTAAVNVQITVSDGQTQISSDGVNFFTSLTLSLSDTSVNTITVKAVDDNIVESPSHTGMIIHTASSSDSDYDGLTIPDVTATITDNDVGFTLISTIQGAGLESSVTGQTVIIEGIVVGDFQGSNGLQGFYVQEEDSDADGNVLTSEGIFVFDGSSPITLVNVGDKVQVTGTVAEFGSSGVSLTQLSSISNVTVVSNNNTLPTAVTIEDLKAANTLTDDSDTLLGLENFEGMRVNFDETLTVTEYFNLGRFGEVVLSVDGRLFQPTNVTSPGTAANILTENNESRRIVLDDGSTQQNRDPILYGRNGNPVSSTNVLRGGDTVDGLSGVLSQNFGDYRVQRNTGVDFQGDARPSSPDDVGGDLKVASFNVLNYFITIDNGSNGARGADTASEFQRQQDKLVTALAGVDADVFGLIELENNVNTLSNLVNALNSYLGSTVYDYIDTGIIGTDAIKVGIIYKTSTVNPVNNFAILDSSVDSRFDDSLNRPVLAQTFSESATGETFTVAVNHLKSKGSLSGDPLDEDQGDGQGRNNFTRTQAAEALVDWLATNPTGVSDSDVLVIGDLNSYAKEDPITTIESAGYVNLEPNFAGDDAYSFVFDGQFGSLDHALASTSLRPQVTGVTTWHINADELNVFDYNEEFNPPSLYTVDPYRTSDHDPVIVGLDLDSNTTSEPFTLQLFHAADQEGGISALDDAPRFSAVLNALRQQDIDGDGVAGYENTLTLSSGDAYIGGLFFDASEQVFGAKGRGDILIQNELGFQAIAFGNHEFDFGTEVVRDLILPDADGYEGAKFPYLSANLDFSGDDNLDDLVVADGQEASSIPNSIAENTVITLDSGERIGVVSAVTPTLPDLTSLGGVTVSPSLPWDQNSSADLDALAAEIQTSVDALLADNPNINKVILLAHMQQIEIELALAERLSDVDIIVAGGSNTRLFDSNDRPRAGDSKQGDYPTFKTDVDGNTVAVVNTDGNYKYVGRLVIDFDSNGNIIQNSYDPTVSGAYATDEQGVQAVGGTGLEDPEVVAITDQLREVIVAQESNIFGISRQFLNGNRAGGGTDGVRNQETNLGNLTADANLAIAKETDASTVISIKNGGGIRASIGRTVVPTGSTGGAVRTVTEAVPDANKPEGGISEADIGNALAFNNSLTLVTVTAQELKDILEYGVSDSTNDPTSSQGRFPQVGGLSFSFDLTQANNSRIQSLAIKDENGVTTDVIVENGVLQGDVNRTFRMVTLGFLADGGDGYTIPQTDRVDLFDSANPSFTGEATFAADGTEQDAFAEYLKDNFFDTPYTTQDVTREFDTRIQNLNFRSDTALLSNISGTPGRDNLTGTAFDDVITGLQGRDTITTLAGSDRIVYTQISDRSDTITDFEVGSDVIDLSQLLDSVGYTGTDAIGDGYVGFRSRGSTSSIITFDSDGSTGSGRAFSFILLQGVTVGEINDAANFVF